MQIHGREFGFRYTVGAEKELALLCPGEDLRQLGTLLTGRTAQALTYTIEALCILSRWDEKARRFEDPAHEEQPLTRELLELLTPGTFAALQIEALRAIKADSTPSVEAESPKKDEAPR